MNTEEIIYRNEKGVLMCKCGKEEMTVAEKYKRERLFTRKEVIALLKLQIAKVRNTVGRMHYKATEDEVMSKIAKCKLIKIPKY